MRYCNKSQTKKDEVLDDSCYMTSTLMASAPKVTLLQLPFSLDTSSTKRENHLLEENFKGNPMKNLSTK